MQKYKIGVLGATGAVGQEMIKVLEERNFPVGELVLLAGARSAGKKIRFLGSDVTVKEIGNNAFDGCDIVLGASPNDISQRYAQYIKAAGAIFVDNSSAFRMDPSVPLVIPEINPSDVKKHSGIVSNPNCSTIVTLVGINSLNKISEIKSMTVSTYQAVSGAGAGGPIELKEEIKALDNGQSFTPSVFKYQIAYNLIPQIGDFDSDGYTSEEMKMQNEGRKILHLPELKVNCTCVRVPVIRSHSVSVTMITDSPISVEEAREAVKNAPGCRLVDDPINGRYPMPIETSNQDLIFVGRIRRDLCNPNGLSLWCCGDQIRKGAATNAVQIAELLIGK